MQANETTSGQDDSDIQANHQHPVEDRITEPLGSMSWGRDAHAWQRFQRHRSDLGAWLVDAATDEAGVIVKPRINAALGGECCVPGVFTVSANGKLYQISLVSTHYEVTEA